MSWRALFENPWGSSPPTLTEKQSQRRVSDLRRRGYKVKEVKLADGTTVVLKSKQALLENSRSDTVHDIVRKAGWSFKLAMGELKSDGAARWHNGLLYVLTNHAGDPPLHPKDPMVVGAYTLDERAGEWIEVGMGDFPDLRSALRLWDAVQIERR